MFLILVLLITLDLYPTVIVSLEFCGFPSLKEKKKTAFIANLFFGGSFGSWKYQGKIKKIIKE